MTKTAFIFDIDGTMANGKHRQPLIRSKPKNWPAYKRLAFDDSVIEPVMRVFHAVRNAGHKTFICSGRSEDERSLTERWLSDKCIINVQDRAFESNAVTELYMRSANDHREDSIIKMEILNNIIRPRGYQILGVFDDRNRVVQAWRKEGLFVFHVDQTSVSENF
jgi:hypothetical protein